jgi:hypothetical protein
MSAEAAFRRGLVVGVALALPFWAAIIWWVWR